jgi:hypothetical protein
VRRFRRKNTLSGEGKNPENPSPHEAEIPSSVSKKSPHPCRRNTLTSGSELPREISPSDLTPPERGAHAHAAQSARVERGNVTETEKTSDDAPLNPANSTSDDATIPEPLRPVPRAEARTVASENQPPPSRVNPIGTPTTAANGARAAFDDVRYAWPNDRIDDDGTAYAAYVSALAAAQGDTDIVLDAIWERLEESGADPPWLSEALKAIERDLRLIKQTKN